MNNYRNELTVKTLRGQSRNEFMEQVNNDCDVDNINTRKCFRQTYIAKENKFIRLAHVCNTLASSVINYRACYSCA
jgi:hypothetical protein